MFSVGDIVYANINEDSVKEVVVTSKIAQQGSLRANIYIVRDLHKKHHYAYEDQLSCLPTLKPYVADWNQPKKSKKGNTMFTTGDFVTYAFNTAYKDRIFRVVSYIGSKDMYKVEETASKELYLFYPDFLLPYQDNSKKPDGGPADYYDIPYKAHTLNDLLEYKGEYHWRGDSFHLANLVKAAWRWGVKQGTTEAYDARKFIYSGARLLMKYAGVRELRDTLQRMLDDPQFKEDDK